MEDLTDLYHNGTDRIHVEISLTFTFHDAHK